MKRSFILIPVLCLSMLLYPVKKGFSYEPSGSDDPPKLLTEAYEPALFLQLQSMQNLIDYIDQTYSGEKNSSDFVNYIGTVISRRFHHGYSYYSNDDNWIASMAGTLFWKNLSAIVVPDDIMKHPVAACSQQSIIMMECARYYGFDVRKVTFDHHFTSEVRIGDKWHYIDPNLEIIPVNQSLKELLQSNRFYPLYAKKLGINEEKRILAHPVYGQTNEVIAEKAMVFQKTTSWMSLYFICLLFMFQAFIFFYYLHKENFIGRPTRLEVIKSLMS